MKTFEDFFYINIEGEQYMYNAKYKIVHVIDENGDTTHYELELMEFFRKVIADMRGEN